ncbi:uncharacterized protein [Rutidosis leptorrhynchoides]|uniref:uncharacterized protein n=1 Tax=Rutidosis leptorrhynchoides TaxID=125765 RepID=UPI003A9A5AB6
MKSLFIRKIKANNTISDRHDSWSCPVTSDGLFSVKEVRLHLDQTILPASTNATIWFKFLPKKVNIFLWRLRLNALPVRWNLPARGVDVDSIGCAVCNNKVESLNHVFFECSLASELWHKIRVWLNCSMPTFSSWDSFIVWLEGIQLSSKSKNRIIASVCTTLWAIWRFRNGIVFNDSFCSRSSLFDVIRLLSFRWIKHRSQLVSNWNSWLLMPL